MTSWITYARPFAKARAEAKKNGRLWKGRNLLTYADQWFLAAVGVTYAWNQFRKDILEKPPYRFGDKHKPTRSIKDILEERE